MVRTRYSRNLVRDLLEAPGFSGLRAWLMWREAKSEHQFVSTLARKHSTPRLELDRLRQHIAGKGQDIFYVLGSGSSVEEIGPEKFDVISRQVSVGINAWALHTFVPDIYCFEPELVREKDHYLTMTLLNRPEVIANNPAILFLKPRTPIELEQLWMVPQELQKGTMLYGRFQPYTRKRENLATDLKMVTKLRDKNLSVLPDSGASIVRMAFLGLLLGFPKVVFVGVDLNHTEYFWEKNPSYLSRFGLDSFESGQKNSSHETLTTHNRAFSVDNFLRAFAQFSRESACSLEVVSPDSLLAEFLPVHRFVDKGAGS